MSDIEITYPRDYDTIPYTTEISTSIGDTLNAIRESVLNMQRVIGLDVDIGLFTIDPTQATTADRLSRIERGIAEGSMVFKEINVSDALLVKINPNESVYVNIGSGIKDYIIPVTITGPLTIVAPQVSDPITLIQTPVKIDVTTFDPNKSANTVIKGYSNPDQPILTVIDTNKSSNKDDQYAVKITGNVLITGGKLSAEYSIDHDKLLNIGTVPTDKTRGSIKHVTQGDYHTHRKGYYNKDKQSWVVSSTVSTSDSGIINHNDLQGWGTLPDHGNDFIPQLGVQYHVTNGDLHAHDGQSGGAQIDHGLLKNINPKYSSHVTGGDLHAHTSSGDGGQISHQDLSEVETIGVGAVHVTDGDNHNHGLDTDGNPIGNGGQIDHLHLKNISTKDQSSLHVTGGDNHTHSEGDGGQIDHSTLSNIGTLSHGEIETKLKTLRATTTGNATFTSTEFNEITVPHQLGTDQFNVCWSLNGETYVPPSDSSQIGVIYISDKTSTSFKIKRIGGLPVGPATKAQMTTALTGLNNDLTYIARSPGSDGNTISIEYRFDSSITTTPFVNATSNPPTITVHYKEVGGYNPTATQVRLAILADPLASSYVDIVNPSGSTGDGYIADMTQTYLTDGYDTTGFQGLSLEYTATAKNY
jgi:hypothetical protein